MENYITKIINIPLNKDAVSSVSAQGFDHAEIAKMLNYLVYI